MNESRPGTSLLFALTLVETLCGREKREVSPARLISMVQRVLC